MASSVGQSPPGSSRSVATSLSSSHLDGSETSTTRYGQEPWPEFHSRVEHLCQQLWPRKELSTANALRLRIGAWLQFDKWLSRKAPSGGAHLIERQGGGDYNRITSISLLSESGVLDVQMILRTPREKGNRRLDREHALLEYVRERSNIPIAKVIFHDFSDENPLDSQYVVQDRIPGRDLDQIWVSLNHPQRMSVARATGGVIYQLLSLESSVTGILEPSSNDHNETKIMPFEFKDAVGDPITELNPSSTTIINPQQRNHETTFSFFKSQFDPWRTYELDRNAGEIDRFVTLYDNLLTIAQEMEDLSLFRVRSVHHCLCHMDLEPRNIMAEIHSDDDTVSVTGILDWDEAVFAPSFVACKPPKWLWMDKEEIEAAEAKEPFWPYECAVKDEPSTLEKQEVKRVFEESAGSEYVRLAYAEEFRIGRVLFALATLGLTSSENLAAGERIVDEWRSVRKSLATK